MRLFASKSLAGGLSAGVILTWAPLLLPGDAVITWLIRGVAWTVLFELLLLGFGPLERALWDTRRGARLANRLDTAGSRLHSGSGRRRFGRLAGIATLPLVGAGVLLAAGLGAQHPQPEQDAQRVVRVTEIKRPVTVKRIVKQSAVPVTEYSAAESPPAVARSATPPARKPPRSPVAKRPAPRAQPRTLRETPVVTPKEAPVPEPECQGGDCAADPAPAVGSQA